MCGGISPRDNASNCRRDPKHTLQHIITLKLYDVVTHLSISFSRTVFQTGGEGEVLSPLLNVVLAVEQYFNYKVFLKVGCYILLFSTT